MFFSKPYYYNTIFNSFKVSLAVMAVSLAIGIVMSYFYSFYELKGSKFILISSILCSMSAPFIGAYAWILLLGRSGAMTLMLKALGIKVGSIYGFGGILLVQATKLYPLVMIYMNGMFANLDNSLMEASSNLGCTGLRRFFSVVLRLSMPTILAAALLVFMRAFADFGTPILIGEGYRTFTVEIYKQFLSETGSDYGFASAISVIAIILTAAIFLLQKYATGKFSFTMNALHPVEEKAARHRRRADAIFCYVTVAVSMLPQLYIIYVSFRNSKMGVFQEGYSLANYRSAIDKLLLRATKNTVVVGIVALAAIVILAVMISYLVVRRPNTLNHAIDTISMLPYIIPAPSFAIALVIGFGKKPLVLTGTLTIMIIGGHHPPSAVYDALRHGDADTDTHVSIEEAAISLGTKQSQKPSSKVTVPMMSNGIISGAIPLGVHRNQVSSAAMLHNNRSITLTVGTYTAVQPRLNLGRPRPLPP